MHDRVNGSGFGIIRAINQPPNSRVNQGSRAHRTGFNCSKQVTVDQAVVSDGRSSITECQNFRVSRWIPIRYIAIPATADNCPIRYDDCTDWNLAHLKGPLGTAQRLFHPEFIVVVLRTVPHERYCN